MTTVRREPPSETEEDQYIHEWRIEGIGDLAAGRHAVGCECGSGCEAHGCGFHSLHAWPINACLTIARALRDFTAYDVEEET